MNDKMPKPDASPKRVSVKPAKALKEDQTKAKFYVRVVLSSFEAGLIAKLRKIDFGTFDVVKRDGEPRKVDHIIDSQVIEESDAVQLQVDNDILEKEVESLIL